MKTIFITILNIMLASTASACGVSEADKDLFYEYVRKITVIEGEVTKDGVRDCDEIIFHMNDMASTEMVLSSLMITVYSKDKKFVLARYGSSVNEVSKTSRLSSACVSHDHFGSSKLTFHLTHKPSTTKNSDGTTMSQLGCFESKTFESMEFLRENS